MDLEDLIGGLLEIEEDELFQQAQNYMASSSPFLNPNFSRQDLVRALGTNEKYLSTSIKDKLNITLKEYIDRYRVNHARTELLMPGDSRSMEEIAVGAGFTSSRTFSRIFQKILESPPPNTGGRRNNEHFSEICPLFPGFVLSFLPRTPFFAGSNHLIKEYHGRTNHSQHRLVR
ncbi:MAG: helix-turn-helix domain-containing protein [Phocaeicola vulgatus]|nr:MAG: helix-turn-helix domain-containing protein [Phocaeicola vulgatus]